MNRKTLQEFTDTMQISFGLALVASEPKATLITEQPVATIKPRRLSRARAYL